MNKSHEYLLNMDKEGIKKILDNIKNKKYHEYNQTEKDLSMIILLYDRQIKHNFIFIIYYYYKYQYFIDFMIWSENKIKNIKNIKNYFINLFK